MSAENDVRKVPRCDRKAPTKASTLLIAKLLILLRDRSFISLTAKSLRMSFSQSPAKPRKAQCFHARKVPQSPHRKVHSYGGRPCVPPPLGLGRPLRCFGVASKAEVKGQTAQRVQMTGIPYRPISAGWF
jgi:hypothetical protein